jgi:predicted ABC-type ATPase
MRDEGVEEKISETSNRHVIAGPNGAGKTTFAADFLPEFVRGREFLNADMIAAGLSPFFPEKQNVRAGRLLLERIEELASAGENFSFETTLAGVTYVKRVERMKKAGYRVVIFFLWLPSADVAAARVATRVRQGGHPIPEQDIRRRYNAGLRNLFHRYLPLADTWWIYDGSKLPPQVVAYKEGRKLVTTQARLYRLITRAAKGKSHD